MSVPVTILVSAITISLSHLCLHVMLRRSDFSHLQFEVPILAPQSINLNSVIRQLLVFCLNLLLEGSIDGNLLL